MRAANEKTTLRVNLFPYLPDAAGDNLKGMAARIKKEFEEQNPSITLEVTLSKDNDFYDLANYKKWINEFDVIEPDTLFLTDLVVPDELIEDWGSIPENDWQPPARNAAKVSGKIYAIPHWMCGYFLFSRSAAIAKVENLKELVAILQSTNGNIPDIAGNLFSSWDTPAMYLDSWEDNHSPADPRQAISTTLDTETIQALKEFSERCNWEGKNPCLDKTYKDNSLAQTRFAKKEVETAFGFSESLFEILKAASADHSIILSPLVLGKGDHPLLFMDGFVMPKGRSKEVKAAALAFAQYMQSAQTYTWIVTSQDAPGTPGRYLTPATISAFGSEPIKSDPYYKAIQTVISKSSNFPNSGLPELHTQMRDAIISELEKPK
jgi:thiamine pyridinylase